MARETFPWAEKDALWYKDAIIYELHVRAFYDSDGNGIGDFRGLAGKLDYLQDLGVTAIWLLPFYPSPLKDDGYDIADYTSVHPAYGTLHDFREFLREARSRGLRVITELVLNHTSDQHAWFQHARRAAPGSPARNHYVWSDTPDKYSDARIIFKDFESSNWAWDPQARAYYWHRFYSHQPDLNYNSATVRRAMLRTVNFWLKLGVSGLRLDAVPYLYEREGTNCENLPETHAYLKELRKYVDGRFKNTLLLAEANQWPEDAAAYFGQGDECNMAFHFPLMPRMFMAIRMEESFPIIDILQQTPPIPENCQWGLFLRNHDELTLEMVTDEERDYMYRVYAHDQQARINLGIRRRLAPLLNNDRKKIELMKSLLFSLPGTPVVYYGDEIGMGDNFYLGDRNGVRTPMQWSADRNAGFSTANPQKLYLPVIIDPEYHYEAVNVETQQNNTDSFLWWMKRIIALRKSFKAFSRGSIEFLYPENRKVLAFLRKYGEETMLVVANLSRLAQFTRLNLSAFAGRVPVEAFGHTDFPPIEANNPYPITLGPYAFYWFDLSGQAQSVPISPSDSVPALSLINDWEELFGYKVRPMLESALLSYLRKRRWFGGKARRTMALEITDLFSLPFGRGIAYLLLMRVDYTEGESETYFLPVTFASGEEIKKIAAEAIIARLSMNDRAGQSEGIVCDALADKGFCTELLETIWRRRRLKGEVGEITASTTRAFRTLCGPPGVNLAPVLVNVEQTNTSVVYGEQLVLKLFRKLEEGISPELEIGLYLTEKKPYPNAPPVAGSLQYRGRNGGGEITLSILHGYIKNDGNAWDYTLDSLRRFYEGVLTRRETPPPRPDRSLVSLTEEPLPALAEETIGPYIASARLLGERTAELHLALGAPTDDPNFAPEPFSVFYQRSIYHNMRGYAVQVFRLLREKLPELPPDFRPHAEKVLNLESAIIGRFLNITVRKISAMRIRQHGDYHLGQVLHTGNNFTIIDFEGEPARPLSERRLKRVALRDVAGMLRSFHYASAAPLLGQVPTALRAQDIPALEQWARAWYTWVSTAFLKSYLDKMKGSGLLPDNKDQIRTLLDALLLDKAIYEVGYELNHRPEWVSLPLQGILQILEIPE